jgi:hypothetical protein
MRVKGTVVSRGGATMPTNSSIQSATGSRHSVIQTLPTSPHNPTKYLVDWFYCSLVVRLSFTFPPLLPRKQLKRFRISSHNGSHQQSETDFYWSLGGRSTRKPPKTPPSLSPSSTADYSRPNQFSASTDPVFLHVTATSNSGIWNSTTLEIF